jgi:hypothetical protein
VLSSELEGLLNAHAFLHVERPPELWPPAAELEPFVRMLGELIAVALARNGGVLEAVTLNVSNVVVEPDAAGPLPIGQHVAVTVSGDGDWNPETTWPALVSDAVASAAAAADAVGGYSRALPESGSVTVLFPREA